MSGGHAPHVSTTPWPGLRKLPFFIALSRQTGRVLMQNIIFAITIKVVFFALALTGHATLWMAVFADMGGSLLVVFNGTRLLRYQCSGERTETLCLGKRE